ncbi:MAG: restriction endonuclease subunit S [Flavobacteriales bacterium]|nr:restriction endonuclease subunit S [Flavobacteriales bacterium]
MKSWKETELGKIGKDVRRSFKPNNETDMPYIGYEHIEQGTLRLIDFGSSKDIQSDKKLFKKGEIIFGTLRPYFRKVIIPQFDGICSTDLAVINANKGYDQKFLFYILASQPLIDFADVSSNGTKMPRAKWSVLAKTLWNVPELPTQQRIASILSAYDDLIEVNNQRIKLLEQTARELYKEWFVRMRFPGYKQAKFKKGIPIDWKIKPIGKVIDYHIGGGWGNEKADNQFSVAGYVIRGTDIPKIRAGQTNPEVYRFHKASNMKSRQLIVGDIVFETAGGSEGQPLGRTCYITKEILDAYGDKVMAASFCKQIRTTSIPSLYLYYFLNYLYDTGMIETFQIQSTGISNYQFEPFLKFQEIILPDDDLMQAFHDKVMLMQKQIAILGTQNSKLREIRDRLLPRLISGKLEIKSH